MVDNARIVAILRHSHSHYIGNVNILLDHVPTLLSVPSVLRTRCKVMDV